MRVSKGIGDLMGRISVFLDSNVMEVSDYNIHLLGTGMFGRNYHNFERQQGLASS